MATTSPTPSPGLAGADPHRGTTVIVGVGVALLAAAIVVSAAYSRADDTLDWSSYGVGLLATGALLAIAGLGMLGYSDRALGTALAAWPSAFGALGAGLMVVVAMDFDDASPWVAGLLVTAIGAAGYADTRRSAPALAAVVGVVVLYAKALDEILTGGGENGLRTGGLVIVGFVLLVTAVAALTPVRDVVAVTVGAFGVLAMIVLVVSASFVGLVSGFTATVEPEPAVQNGGSGAVFGRGAPTDPLEGIRDDLYALLVLGAILVLAWVALAAISGHSGYRVLVVALTAIQLPVTVGVLGVEHPSSVAAAVAVGGAAALGVALARARTSGAPGGGTPAAPYDVPPTPPTA